MDNSRKFRKLSTKKAALSNQKAALSISFWRIIFMTKGSSYLGWQIKNKERKSITRLGWAFKPEGAAKRDISVLFAPLALVRRKHYCARSKQKSLEISWLCGRRFWKERIFVQPRHKTQEILYVFPSILTKDERKSAFPKRVRVWMLTLMRTSAVNRIADLAHTRNDTYQIIQTKSGKRWAEPRELSLGDRYAIRRSNERMWCKIDRVTRRAKWSSHRKTAVRYKPLLPDGRKP